MSDKSVAEKAHVKPGTSVAVVNAPDGVIDGFGLPESTTFVAPSDAQIVIVFVGERSELDELVPSAIATLSSGAVLWVVYRKGGKGAGLDMTRDDVWYAVEPHGMRPLGLVGVDEAWSIFRFKQGDADAGR